jgi:16S rRNA (guanine527-N7)-methyltransferase
MESRNSTSLLEALRKFDVVLDDRQASQMDRYRALLWKWNERLNLTRHTDFDTFVSRDVIDSLELGKLIGPGEEVLDVGSGGGVPGIPLAILRPDVQIDMCDSVQKKAKVLESMVSQLELPVAVHHCRAEQLLEDLRFDSVVARAIGPLWKICRWFEPYWASIGRLLLIKGPRWVEERAEARERGLMNKLELRRAAAYPLAGSHAQSVILQLSYRRS